MSNGYIELPILQIQPVAIAYLKFNVFTDTFCCGKFTCGVNEGLTLVNPGNGS